MGWAKSGTSELCRWTSIVGDTFIFVGKSTKEPANGIGRSGSTKKSRNITISKANILN